MGRRCCLLRVSSSQVDAVVSDVQRWNVDLSFGGDLFVPADDGAFVEFADHARIVAEAGAAVFAFHPEWTVTGMCDSDCLACRRLTELITERSAGYEEGKADAEQAHAAALAEAEAASTVAVGMTVEAALAECIVEVVRVDSFEDIAGHFLKDRDEVEDAIRRVFHKWANKAAAPRTLTADDPGYHSQRCLHCDHIRATHTLTAHGCIGHALPGRPGADCPCAEFIHDGVATPEVKPCSTCGEPVAYLTARPGWAGGWLHHPARPLDGHPAAIDGEATT